MRRSQLKLPASLWWSYAIVMLSGMPRSEDNGNQNATFGSSNLSTDRTAKSFPLAVSKKNPPAENSTAHYCTSLHRDRFCELRARGIYRPFAGLRTKGQFLCSDESDIGDAYKAQ